MIVTAAQVADTLRLLMSGFIAMKLFCQFGLQTKRSDAQWVVWSLLAAVPVNATADALYPTADILHSLIVVTFAVLSGAALMAGWRTLTGLRPGIGRGYTIRAWDNIFSIRRQPWLQVETTDGRVLSGWAEYAAKSVDTDDLNLYLAEPRLIEKKSYIDMPTVAGILLTRSRIAYISVMKPGAR